VKLTIESTDQVTHLEGVPVRVWRGRTERGIACLVFVHRVAVHEASDSAEFERELRDCLPPGWGIALRRVLGGDAG
jgi:hypothetical protein